MAIAKLKDCPKCGSDDVSLVAHDDGERDVYKAWCRECYFELDEYRPNRTQAAKAWNEIPREPNGARANGDKL